MANIRKARNGRSSRKGATVRELRVINLHPLCGIDQDAFDVLMVVTKYRRTHLFYEVYNALLGFDAVTQGYMTEAVALYYAGHARTRTSLPSVDAVLDKLYKVIDTALAKGE